MRIDRILVVGVLTLIVMTGCKGKKEPAATPSPKVMNGNPVPSLMK